MVIGDGFASIMGAPLMAAYGSIASTISSIISGCSSCCLRGRRFLGIMRIPPLISIVCLVSHLGSSVLLVGQQLAAAETLEKLGQLLMVSYQNGDSKLIDKLILDTIPVLFNQKPCNSNGTFEHYQSSLIDDKSNEDIVNADIEVIIKRSGYGLETYKVVADDGYITSLFRIINPLADREKLRQPPVMIMHGGTIDPVAYVWASAIQHHPEKYPRSMEEDGPITSWNRSLAFMLSNNGYDVWLVGTRGADRQSQGKLPLGPANFLNKIFQPNPNRNMAEQMIETRKSVQYWHYSFDDIIEFEAPKQLDKILQVTGAKNVTLFSFSYSSMGTLCILGMRPDIAKNKIHNYINMAPIINLDSANTIARTMCKIIPQVPATLGNPLVTQMLDSQATRTLLPMLTISKEARYTIAKLIIALALGSSGKFRTMLEPPVMGHVLQPVAFKQLQHSCQMANAKQYQKFDYGPLTNLLVYNQLRPPVYNISNIHVKNWMLISGENDNFGCQSSIKQILDQVNPKPLKHRAISGYSHLDLIAGIDNDIQVNLPVLEFLDQFALK